MGIVTFAAPVSGLRGKVGGNIFSANKSGPYLKIWGKGTNPRTLKQTTQRGKLTIFAQSWAGLTTGEKTGWDTYAALPAQDKTNSLGETFSISGFAWYVAINLNLMEAGAAQRTAAPTIGTPATPVVTNLRAFETAAAGTTNILLTAGSPGINEVVTIHSILVNSIGHLAQAQVRTHMVTKNFGVGIVNLAFKTELLDQFGTAFVGQRCFATVAVQDSEGRRGLSIQVADNLRA